MSDDSGVAVKPARKDPGERPTSVGRQRSSVLRIARLRDLALIPAILLIGAVGVYVSPVFLTRQNLTNILQQQSEISLVVLGEATGAALTGVSFASRCAGAAHCALLMVNTATADASRRSRIRAA